MLTGTEIKGEIHGFLSAENSPYLATGNLVVLPNTALFIQPGTTILFMPGTGLEVNEGQFMAAGTSEAPITFRSAKEPATPGDWKGITITGKDQVTLRNIIVSDAVAGIAVENGSLNMQVSKITGTSSRGLYVRNADVNVLDCEFTGNKGAALHISNYAMANIERSTFTGNNIAMLNSELANTIVLNSKLENNDIAVIGKENNLFFFHATDVTKNKIGAAGADVLDETVIASIKGNENDFDKNSINALNALPPNPEIPGIEKRPWNKEDKIGVLAREAEEKKLADSTKKGWAIMGNVMLGGKYHYVATAKNDGEDKEVYGDTIRNGEKFENTFQVPGLSGEASAYIYMQSPDGKTIEFNTDLTADSWNHFSPNPVTLTYTDKFNTLVLGDEQKVGGDIYMAGLPLFGVDYTLALFKNNADQPLFELNGFFGEAQRSIVADERHPYIYKEYAEDGSAQAQRIAYGGSLKWAPVRRFDAKFGILVANDEIEDPILRKGSKNNNATSEPMIDAFTMFADGNWLFFPGDIELNGQIAVGRADTTDVIRQRAINQVFSDAGLSTGSFNEIRKLMQNTNRINYLKHNELVNIFGENTTLRDSEMRDSLRTLIRDAKEVQRNTEDDRDNDRVLGLNWGSQNFALGASLNWNIYKTHLSGHIKYVGEDFYSAGSADQLADTREFGGRVEQDITKFWILGFDYLLNVENAAKKGMTNLFGLGEGTRWGFFQEASDEWKEEHRDDNDRTKYIHTIGTDQRFNIGKNVVVTAGYTLQYQTQYRNFQLHGDYILEDNIYSDSWFNPRKKRPTADIIIDGDTVKVDSARWTDYNYFSAEPYLASNFNEKLFKHTWNAGVTVKAFNTVFKADGRWTLRTDASEFEEDDIVYEWDLADTTWAKLGYYYGGSDYFEQCYPLSATTTYKTIQNRIGVTPRFKSYKRDDMMESEITVEDELEVPLMGRFLILGINGQLRYMTTEWNEGSEKFDESETDIIGNMNLRVNHTKHLYSDWGVGTNVYLRPDDLSSQYVDIYGGVNVNYVF